MWVNSHGLLCSASWFATACEGPFSFSLCSFFLQATNRAFSFSFFTISDVHDSYGLYVLAVKTTGLIQVLGSFCILIWKQIIIAMSLSFPLPFPVIWIMCKYIRERKTNKDVNCQTCVYLVITYPAMKYFEIFSSQNCALVIDSIGTSADARLLDTLIGYELIM